jgi:hypothetical protein
MDGGNSPPLYAVDTEDAFQHRKKEIKAMDIFTQQMMKNIALKEAQDLAEKRRLDPNYMPPKPNLWKLIRWPVGIIAAIVLFAYFMAH